MTDVIRVPFERHHYDLIVPDPKLVGLKAAMRVDTILARGNGLAWVDRARGEVLAMTGYIERCPNVFWMWFLTSQRGSRGLVRFARHFGTWIATLAPGIRLEAHVLASFNEGNRWAEMLGFERETDQPIEKWDGRDDYHLYARVTGAANA